MKVIILKIKRWARKKELWVLLLVVIVVVAFFVIFGIGAGKESKKAAEAPIKSETVQEASASSSSITGPLTGDTFTLAQQEGGGVVVVGQIKSQGKTRFAIARYGENGSLDKSFGGSGKMATGFGDADNTAYAAVVQADEKVIVGGASGNGKGGDFAMARFNVNGTLDSAFGNGGKVVTDLGGEGDVIDVLSLSTGGKILAFGESWQKDVSYFALIRYNSDGTLDISFGDKGKAVDPFEGSGASMAVGGDGKIVVGGITHIIKSGNKSYAVGVARYNSNGTLDNTFGDNGKVVTNAGGMSGAVGVVIQSDGKIVLGGTASFSGKRDDLALMRLNRDGSLDKSFGSAGVVTVDFGDSSDTTYVLQMQDDGKFVVAGTIEGASGDFGMARITGGGQLDNTFGSGGRVTHFGGSKIVPLGLKIQKDGKILVAGVGEQNAFVIARFGADGSADASFKRE